MDDVGTYDSDVITYDLDGIKECNVDKNNNDFHDNHNHGDPLTEGNMNNFDNTNETSRLQVE